MSAAQLSERTRSLILSYIKNNIGAELAAIRADRQDPSVSTEPPKSYFDYEGAHTYQCPAIFIVIDSFVPMDKQGPNHVNAVVTAYVTAVVEDREAELLVKKTERYQAALFKILQWADYVDIEDNVKLWSEVVRCRFSALYTKDLPADQVGRFRKEVSLELAVKHWENPTV